MITQGLHLVGGLLMVAGLVFFLGTVVGVVRFPDFYTRMHAAAKGDTVSSLLVLLGFALYHLEGYTWEEFLVSAKVLFIMGFVFVASPTASHALIDAGYATGQEPWTRPALDTDGGRTAPEDPVAGDAPPAAREEDHGGN